MNHSSNSLTSLTLAWLGLLALTGVSLLLGSTLHGQMWLPLLVAGILWLKAWIVIRYFIEADTTHGFIRKVLYGFIGITPLCIALLGFWGDAFARFASLS